MLATVLDRPQEVIERALDVFARFGMIEYDDDCAFLPNWYKYQSADALDKLHEKSEQLKEQNKARQQRFRDKQKSEKRNVTFSVTNNGHKKEELEKEIDLKELKPLSDKMPDEPEIDPIPYAEIVDYLNDKCGTAYRSNGKKTRDLIRARWNDKYRLVDFKTVIDKKHADWNNTDHSIYLRPETLFGNKFEGYLNQPAPRGGAKGGASNGKQGNTASEDNSIFLE
jgi:uncharacterized phage protein (TIGR02220 family)